MTCIAFVGARKVYDSRGDETIEVEVRTLGGMGKVAAPAGKRPDRNKTSKTAAAFGGCAEPDLKEGYPRVANDAALLQRVQEVGGDLLGTENVRWAEAATMGGDDFGFYLKEVGGVPGCAIRLGVESDQALHTDGFDFGHEALSPGTLLLINLIGSYR